MYAKNGSEFLTLDLAHHWKGYKPAEDSTSIGISEGFCKNTYLVIKNSEIHISNTHRQLYNDGWMDGWKYSHLSPCLPPLLGFTNTKRG